MNKLLSLLLLSAFIASSAHAVSVNSINVQTFNPSTGDRYVLLEDTFRSEWPKNSKLYLGANYNYVSEPFVALDATTGARSFSVIDAIQTFDLMIGFKASSRFGLFFGMPIHFVRFPNSLIRSAGNETGLGDMKILGKIRLTDDDATAHFALIPEIHLPTGSTATFVSDASTYLGIRAALERQFTHFTLNVNLGFGAASNSIYSTVINGLTSTIDYRKRFNFGIGGFMPFTDKWGMNLEFNSLNMIPFDKNINPNELYGGLRHVLSENAILTFGASLGKIGGSSGQNFRFIAGLRFNIQDDANDIVHPITPVAVASTTPIAAPRVVMKAKQIELSTPVNFEENSSLLTQEGKDLLDEVADVMSKNRNSFKKILIDGHTNNKGQQKHNLWLSLERSKSVKHYLVGKGIDANTLEARGFGQIKPKIPYTNKKAMEINRRVEFNIVH